MPARYQNRDNVIWSDDFVIQEGVIQGTRTLAFLTVPARHNLSPSFGTLFSQIKGVWSPVVDSCHISLKASFDQKSENFTNLIDWGLTNPSSDSHGVEWRWAVGPGSKGLILNNRNLLPFVKLETSVNQTDTRTFVILYA